MKKIYLSILLAGSTFMGVNAQLAPGTPAPDFTATDLNGVSHTLSSYLAAGKTVIIDISATWCGPCWSYHSSHALAEFYKAYGPEGSDEVMVFFVEGDNATTVADLNGTGGNTQGNWVEGTPYPILNNATIADDYAITYFPTVYRICPDGLAYEIDQLTAVQLKANVNANCGTLTGVTNHAEIEGSEVAMCSSDAVATATLANFGTNAITSATVLLKENGTTVNTANYTGNITQFNTATVTFPSGTYNMTSNYTVELTNVNSGAPFNSAYASADMSFVSAALVNNTVEVKVYTDNYPSETSWEIRNSATNAIVASGGPYQPGTDDQFGAGGADALTTKIHSVTLPSGSNCYKVILNDAYDDGFGYGTNPAGQYGMEIFSNGTSVLNLDLGNFGSTFTRDAAMKTDASSSVFELNTDALNVYPNPASDELFVQFEALASEYTISISDLQGRMIYSSNLNGVSGTQNVSVPVKEFSKGSYIVNVTSMGVTRSQHVVIK
jgi:thiol-disulfide isomerase/thioredoxin